MKLTDNWFTALADSEEGEMIFISGREDMKPWAESGKFKERAEIYWKYEKDSKGMPADKEAMLMEKVQDGLKKVMEQNKLAILTGVYTGAGERTMIFYTRNVAAFGQMLNEVLLPFETLPITIYTEKDPDWEEYAEMYEMKDLNADEDIED